MDDRTKQLLSLAHEHYDKREFDRAEPLVEQILTKVEHYADVHNMLGVMAHERGDFVRARVAFERAVEINPRYTEAILNLAVCYNDLGEYERGRETYERVRQSTETSTADGTRDPFALGKIANKHADLAQAYADLRMPEAAIEELRKAVGLRPTFVDLHVRLGVMLRDHGRLDEAREIFESVVSNNPAFVSARVQLGVTLFLLASFSQAESTFRAALEADPGHKIARMYLRLVEARQGR